jgi:hypothetical protein
VIQVQRGDASEVNDKGACLFLVGNPNNDVARGITWVMTGRNPTNEAINGSGCRLERNDVDDQVI